MAQTLSARIEHGLDRLHARVRTNPLLRRFTVCNRILLGIGFIPPSIVKIQGGRFTSISTDHPVGYFFEAMYRTGAYWNFIGWAQLIGALLLLNPRTATLGAVVFFPIILNIFVITVSLHFAGTWVITALMLLACTYLLCWDYDRFKPLFFPPRASEQAAISPRGQTLERGAYVAMAVCGLYLTLLTRGYVPMGVWALLALVGGVAGFACMLVAIGMELRARRMVA